MKPEDICKQYFGVFLNQFGVLSRCLVLTIVCLMSSAVALAGNPTNTGDELISLAAKNEPLGDVLNKISTATGYEILLDHNWRDYPVSVNLEKVPLDKGLKRILKDLNNVIVYVSEKKIKIIIYNKMSPQKEPLSPSNERVPVSPDRSYQPEAPGIPDSQALKKEESPPDNSDVSDEELDAGPPVNGGGNNKRVEHRKKKTDNKTSLGDNSSRDRLEQNSESEYPSDGHTEK